MRFALGRLFCSFLCLFFCLFVVVVSVCVCVFFFFFQELHILCFKFLTFIHSFILQSSKVQVEVRAAVVSTVYDKSLRVRMSSVDLSTKANDSKYNGNTSDDNGRNNNNNNSKNDNSSNNNSSNSGERRNGVEHSSNKDESPPSSSSVKNERGSCSTGEIMNLMSTDCDRVANFCPRWGKLRSCRLKKYFLHFY